MVRLKSVTFELILLKNVTTRETEDTQVEPASSRRPGYDVKYA